MNLDKEPDDGNVCYYTGIERENKWNVIVFCVKSRVGVIKDGDFDNCTGSMTIFFNKRLDSFGVSAFCRCRSLRSINMPCYVRVIKKGAFQECDGLMTQILSKGLR